MVAPERRSFLRHSGCRMCNSAEVGLEIPQLRKGSYFPSFLAPRRTAEKALTAVIQEAYVHRV
jgi:transposase-like protein